MSHNPNREGMRNDGSYMHGSLFSFLNLIGGGYVWASYQWWFHLFEIKDGEGNAIINESSRVSNMFI